MESSSRTTTLSWFHLLRRSGALKRKIPTGRIEIEVETVEDALTAAQEGADIILCDNMTPDRIRNTIMHLEKAGLRDRVTIELSGGITAGTISEYARYWR